MPVSRFNWRHTVAASLGLTPAILLMLHASAILPLTWERVPLQSIQSIKGAAYTVTLGGLWMSRQWTGDSPAQVLEDGTPLPLPNAHFDDIAALGHGRFALDDGHVNFSASDSSDPSTNGRRYELNWPAQPSGRVVEGIVLLAIATLLWLGLVYRGRIGSLLKNPPVWFAPGLFLLLTVIARLWFFLQAPVPGLYGDSTSYYALVQTMDAGNWPHFTIRTPGYPLFLKLIFSLSNTVMAVMIAQSVLMIAAATALIYAFHTIRPWLSIWAALGMSVFSCGLWSIENDTAMLSDAPYSSTIIFVLAFLILGLVRGRAIYWGLTSLAMAVTILIRPAGMFLFVVYVMCLAFLLWNRFARRHSVSFALPLPAIMLALCTYNYATFGSFAMTAFGESQIAFATFTFWEEDTSYPPNVNDAVRRTQEVMRKQLDDDRLATLRTSWDYPKLVPIFLTGMNYQALDQASTLDGKSDYLAARAWIQKISLDSIRKHPDLYVKFMLTQLWLQYIFNINYQEDFLLLVQNRIVDVYGSTKYQAGTGVPFYIEMAKEYGSLPAHAGFQMVGEGSTGRAVVTQASLSRRVYRMLLRVRRACFSNVYWVWLYFVALGVSAIRLLVSKARHTGAFIAFIMTISLFGASLVVALVEYGGYRYSYVMEYIYYLPILVLPFLRIDPPIEAKNLRTR